MPNPVAVDNQFWLQAMGDHAIIIYETLSPVETGEIQKAGDFISLFNNLLANAREAIGDKDIEKLKECAQKAIRDFRDFKLHILTRQLTGHIRIALPTAVINHMVNEADEYIYNLGLYTSNTIPQLHPIHYDLVWILDALGHANLIQSYTSYPFNDLVEEAGSFAHKLSILYNRTMEFAGYLRTGLKNFIALDQLHKEAFNQMRLFAEFFVDLELKISNKSIVVPLTVLFLDHMYREECYYLTRLASVTNQSLPACDPAAPRKIL